MRQKKAQNLKAVLLTMSVPPAIKQYIVDDCDNAGFTVQRWVAERVLGPIMDKHWEVYTSLTDIRYKPEPLKKSYIRMLRWVLESRITRAWQAGKLITFEVDWLMTGGSGLYTVSIGDGPGFVHVIYDWLAVAHGNPENKYGVPTEFLVEPRDLCTVSERYKWAVAQAWFRHSYRGAE